MLRRIVSSLKYRARWAQLGVIYGKSLKLSRVRIGRRRIDLHFPVSERDVHEHEFGKIVFGDCYRLHEVPDARTVLDIGANIGLFALAARRAFPKAKIHCYEPNPAISHNLETHCIQAGCDYFLEAVGLNSGKASLNAGANGTLFTTTTSCDTGQINQVSFANAVARLGAVDLLKLDCEGAEWEIFRDQETWKRVRHLVMEYHLWAQPSSSVQHLREVLSSLGFSRIEIQEDAPQWGLAFAWRSDDLSHDNTEIPPAAPSPDRSSTIVNIGATPPLNVLPMNGAGLS